MTGQPYLPQHFLHEESTDADLRNATTLADVKQKAEQNGDHYGTQPNLVASHDKYTHVTDWLPSLPS